MGAEVLCRPLRSGLIPQTNRVWRLQSPRLLEYQQYCIRPRKPRAPLRAFTASSRATAVSLGSPRGCRAVCVCCCAVLPYRRRRAGRTVKRTRAPRSRAPSTSPSRAAPLWVWPARTQHPNSAAAPTSTARATTFAHRRPPAPVQPPAPHRLRPKISRARLPYSGAATPPAWRIFESRAARVLNNTTQWSVCVGRGGKAPASLVSLLD